MLLTLTRISVILFLFLELEGAEVHVEEFLLPLREFSAEVFIVHHGLVEARSDIVQDDIDLMVVCYLGIEIESIDIVQVFLHYTCLFEITNLVKSPV